MRNETPADNLGLLLTADEVAAELRTSTEYVRRLWREEKLPSLVLPSADSTGSRARRMRRSDLLAWINDQPSRAA